MFFCTFCTFSLHLDFLINVNLIQMVFQTIRTLERLGAAPALVGFVVSFPSKRLHFGGRLWMKQAFLLKQKEKNT